MKRFITMLCFAAATASTGALADVAVDGRFKGTVAGVFDGGRDLGLLNNKDHQEGYIDLTPWVHFQFSTHWDALLRVEGYAQSGQLLRPSNESDNVQTVGNGGANKYGFVGLKEAWIEYAGITDYPGEFLRVGRQRIRQDDGEWWDIDIDAARWVLDTTQFQAEFGGARQFLSYRTDDPPIPKDQRKRTYVFGSIGGEWLERNRLTLRGVYANDREGHLPDSGTTPGPNDKLEGDDVAWIGLIAHDHYFDWKRPPHFGYWAQAIALTGKQRRTRLVTTTDPANPAVTVTTVDNPPIARNSINAWAGEGGLKICMPRRWPIQFGGLFAYSTGARGTDVNGDPDRSKQFFQTGVESNYSRFTGTRSLIHRFNEAYRAELGNLTAATAFTAIDVGHWDASAVFNQFWRTERGAPVVTDGIVAQPVNDFRELGRGYDLIVSRYFQIRSEDVLEDTEGEAESSAVRVRGSVFEPGAAYEDATHHPHDEYRAVLEIVLWF